MKKVLYIAIIIFSFLIGRQNLLAYRSTDSLRTTDSIMVADSAATENPLDSLKRTPNPKHGSLSQFDELHINKIGKEEIIELHYNDLYDILDQKLNSFPLSLGEYGRNSGFSVMGGMPQSVSLQFDGRPLIDPQYGSMNFSQFPVEMIENIEILYGSDAAILSDNGGSALFNLQEKLYNINRPYTRIWFAQSGFNFIGADGIFSQNFHPEWNLALGFRNLKAQGQYDNSHMNSWNVRGILRYSPSERTSISLTENFSNHKTGLNGGINKDLSYDITTGETTYYDDLEAVVNYQSMDERNFRHDLTLNFSTVSLDSARALTSSVFFTNIEWIKGFDSDSVFALVDTSYHLKNTYNYGGLRIDYEERLAQALSFKAGFLGYYQSSPGDYYVEPDNNWSLSGYGRVNLNLTDKILISGGGRYRQKGEDIAISLGGSALYEFGASRIKLDASYSDRLPYAFEGLALKKEKHLLTFMSFDSDNLNITAYFRTIGDPIEARADTIGNIALKAVHFNGNQRIVTGVSAGYAFRLAEKIFGKDDLHIQLKGAVNKVIDGSDFIEYPIFYGGVDVYYNLEVGRSQMRVGADVKILTEGGMPHYLPQQHSWTYSSVNNDFAFNGLRAYATLRLGTAWVKLSYDNILSYGYFYVPLYPQLGGNFRLQVAWAFLD